jgi:hypothetical protein
MSRRFVLYLPVLISLSLVAGAEGPVVHRENIEWCDVWMPNMNKQDLPRVLLIGDSITRAYFPTVEAELKDKAYVARIATSKAVGDPALLSEIQTFATQAKFDVVHFNIGMHGWDYSEAQYRENLPGLVAAIRKAAPGAKLVWAHTTPVRKDREKGASNARIQERNKIAAAVMAAEKVPVDDLHAMISDGPFDLHSDDVHFTKAGNTVLGKQVAASVSRLLPQAQ